MEEYLTCAVCLELFDSQDRLPLILSCGHSLCKTCIINIRQAQGFIICPIDRSPESKPMEALIKNLALLQLVDVSRFTDYPRCAQHPSKKLKYYCHTPCAQAFCSKCLMAHNCHSCIDPEDAKSLEALLHYIDSERFKLNTETEHNQTLIECYSRQLDELEARKLKLVDEISREYHKLFSRLAESEREAVARVTESAAEVSYLIEESRKKASAQMVNTSSDLQEINAIQEFLKKSLPHERLKHVIRLHKLLTNRVFSFQVGEDYLKRLPHKIKLAIGKILSEVEEPILSKKSMVLEDEVKAGLVGYKRTRTDDSQV